MSFVSVKGNQEFGVFTTISNRNQKLIFVQSAQVAENSISTKHPQTSFLLLSVLQGVLILV